MIKQMKRIREWMQIPGQFQPGVRNSITDVDGVLVGHCTLHGAQGIHTGITVIRPHTGDVFAQKTPAAVHCANGFGKMVGAMQVEELGEIESLIGLTNTLSVAQVLQGLLEYHVPLLPPEQKSINIVVGETNDAVLNDIRHFSVRPEHVREAIEACSAEVLEGAVGAGAGTRCFGFKGGIGTSSRLVSVEGGDGAHTYTIGALVQTNYGGSLNIYGRRIPSSEPRPEDAKGSCMVVVATDAPMEGRQLKRLAKRAVIGLTNTGSYIQHGSGEFIIAFSNCPDNLRRTDETQLSKRTVMAEEQMDPFFEAVAEAVQEAVYNSLTMACDMQCADGRVIKGFDFAEYLLPTGTARLRSGRLGQKTVGIIGGMGPMATVDLYAKIVAATKADGDGGHLHILIDNDPSIPDRTAAILDGGVSPVDAMRQSAVLLESSGADLLVMPCNTAHYYYDGVQEAVHIPLLNMVRLAAEECKKRGYNTVGLLSTTGTAKAGVYRDTLNRIGLGCLCPTDAELDIVMKYIYGYKAGKPAGDLAPLRAIIRGLKQRGAQAIIMGCTELPLILAGTDFGLPYIDPALLLATEAVRQAQEER